jgi:hypothetical protein
MRYLIGFIFTTLIGFITSKFVKNGYSVGKLETSYDIRKIDSINNWYLIYARKGDSLFKIVSKKTTIENCNKIQINKKYDLQLHSRIYGYAIAGKTMSPQNTLLVNCFSFDDSTNICLEGDSIRDLFYADNIKGLCFEKDN